ncbi:MAG: nitroreductase family protein [Chloroflexi bacterium]|nr:nitroreductase family protein [Chloroflexota bacterium]
MDEVELQLQSPLLQIMRSRRSIRRYHPDSVSRAVVENLLEAAGWAPSAHNRQPWRFVVVESDDVKTKLADAMGARLRQDLAQDGASADVIEADAARSVRRLSSAPILIVVCLTMTDMDVYPDRRRSELEHRMAVQSAAMAGQNLLLAAHDAGLGACWMCAPLFCPDAVSDVLQLPADWQPQGLITLGYPAESREKTRRPPGEITLWR